MLQAVKNRFCWHFAGQTPNQQYNQDPAPAQTPFPKSGPGLGHVSLALPSNETF